MAMTPKKRKFADALMAGRTNKAAALAAGYSAATASQAGSRLAKDPDVKAYLVKHGFPGVKPDADAKAMAQDTPERAKARKDAKAASAAANRAVASASAAGFSLDDILTFKDPRDYLMAVINDIESDQKFKVQAALGLMPYVHAKKGEGGKKDARDEAARAAASKFGGAPPAPRLAATGGRKV